MDITNWYEDAVFYEMYIRAFRDGNGDGHGDFRGAIEKLDHVKSLGVDCIWILPMYPSPLRDDGYDVADYLDIHEDYGTLDDFQDFLRAAHERGLKVITDMVMNHTSNQHPWFQMARHDRESPYRDYYVWSDTGTEYAETRVIFLDYEPSNWTYDETAEQYFWHRFYRTQPDLNYDNPQVHEEMFRALRFWLDMGVDGFRADAVPYLYEREGTNCENLPETHEFLQKVRRFIDEEYPGRVLIAESNMWPEDLLPYFGDGTDEFHMCFHFPIMPRLFMALRKGDKSSIISILSQTPDIPPGTQWMTFLRNHDELTLEMVTTEDREWMWEHYAPEPRMRLNLGIRRRLAPLLNNEKPHWFLLHAIFLSLPGAPIIYYGDEIGMGDNIWLPDRHGCRTPMQWDDSPNGGFSEAETTYLPANDDEVFGYQHVNVAAQEDDPNSYLNLTRFLIKTRQAQPALRRGTMEFVKTADPGVLTYWRHTPGQHIFCLFNLTEKPKTVTLDVKDLSYPLKDLLHPDAAPTETNTVELAPHAAHWFVPIP